MKTMLPVITANAIPLESLGIDSLSFFSDSVKTVKGEKYGYLTLVQYLSPADYLTRHTGQKFPNLCPHASEGCREACLGEHSGRMVMSNAVQARVKRTLAYHLFRDDYLRSVVAEIERKVRKARKKGMRPVVRLNGSSDVLWERVAPFLFAMFPDVEFYDYTKVPIRFRRNLPANYHLTFSRSGSNDSDCAEALREGVNVAVVFRGALPETFTFDGVAYPVVNGDDHDIRLPEIDGTGVIIGLVAKGKGKKDISGFVVD